MGKILFIASLLGLSLCWVFIPVGRCGEVFHNGGTGDCQGCHTIPPKLLGTDASSTCLGCHQAGGRITLAGQHQVATNPGTSPLCAQLSPGGDFCWLKKDYRWSVSEVRIRQSSDGDSHGHNIVAIDYGYGPDSVHTVAPGGIYPAASLSCISCHDPHGNYRRLADGTIATAGPQVLASGSYANSPDPTPGGAVGVYRMLAGKGYQPINAPGVPVFTADPPAAVSPPHYNRAETFSPTRVVYGAGMSEWCLNCHPQLNGINKHQVGGSAVLTAEIISNYNKYISSGNMTGSHSTAYTSLVPYEVGLKDYARLKMLAVSAGSSGPSGGENVMCLTCHRAHASGWDHMLRWNMQGDFIVYAGEYPGIDNATPPEFAQGRSVAETRKAMYDRLAGAFASYQRNFCNKCHGQD